MNIQTNFTKRVHFEVEWEKGVFLIKRRLIKIKIDEKTKKISS